MLTKVMTWVLSKLGIKWYEGFFVLLLGVLIGIIYFQRQWLEDKTTVVEQTRHQLEQLVQTQELLKDTQKVTDSAVQSYYTQVTQERREQSQDLEQLIKRYLALLKPPVVDVPFVDPSTTQSDVPVVPPTTVNDGPPQEISVNEASLQPSPSRDAEHDPAVYTRLQSLVDGMHDVYCRATTHGVGCPAISTP